MRNQKKEEDRTGEKEDLVLQQRSNNFFFLSSNFTRYNKTETLRVVAPLEIVVRKF